MPDMKFTLPGQENITLPFDTVDKLIAARNGDAALLYLYVLRTREETVDKMSMSLGKSEREILAALTALNDIGLIRFDGKPQPIREEAHEYTTADLKREMRSGTKFYILVQEVQRSLGGILSSNDLMRLFGMYDHLGLPPEVILCLITYCITEYRKRFGDMRLPKMSYIEKAAYTWEREGVVTLDRAEEYLKNLEEIKGASSEIKRLLQIRDRDFSAMEQKYVDSWVSMGFPLESVEIAYERTLLKTGKLAWPYMDSIMNNWHGKNLQTRQEIENRDGKPPLRYGAATQSLVRVAPDDEEFERMKSVLVHLQGERE
jgi:DNA replication protein DnaD